MNILCVGIANWCKKNGAVSEEDYPIVLYGVQVFFNTSLKVLGILLIGALLHCLTAVLLSITVFCSMLTVCVCPALSAKLDGGWIPRVMLCMFVCFVYAVVRYAPCNSEINHAVLLESRERIWNRYRGCLAAIISLILLFAAALPVQAAKSTQNIDLQEENQIIFLIDGSYSMAGERWQEALECLQMIDAMLPSGYQTALLVYSEGVDFSVDFGQTLEDGMKELKSRRQQGYTNPGEALETALEMFDLNSPGGKYVVLISDGEISMRTAEDTGAAVMAYLDAVSQAADKGVIVDLLLYETEDIEDQISDGAALTGGTRFYRTEGSATEEIAESYLFDRLALDRIILGLADSSDNLMDVSLQDTFAERARILLTCESRIQDIHVTCRSREIRVVQGENFAVITLERPMEETVNLQYTLAEKGRMNAYLVKEYDLTVNAEASYVPETGDQQILVHMVNSDGKEILEDQDIREAVSIYIDGEKAFYEVSRGKAAITWTAEASREVSLKVDFGGLNSPVYCKSAESSLWLEVPLPETSEEDDSQQYFWLWVVVAGICVVFVILFCLLLHSCKKKPKSPKMRARERPTLMKY